MFKYSMVLHSLFCFSSLNLRRILKVRFLNIFSEELIIIYFTKHICFILLMIPYKLLCKSFHTYWLYWKSNQASNTRERVGKQVEEVNFCFSSYPPAPEKQPSHRATHKLYCSVLEFSFI